MGFRPERLEEWRKKRGLTQEQLAKKIGTTKGTISNYENGHSSPKNEMLVAIADVLNVITDCLLGRTDVSVISERDDEDCSCPDLKELINNAKRLSPRERKALNEFLKACLGNK